MGTIYKRAPHGAYRICEVLADDSGSGHVLHQIGLFLDKMGAGQAYMESCESYEGDGHLVAVGLKGETLAGEWPIKEHAKVAPKAASTGKGKE